MTHKLLQVVKEKVVKAYRSFRSFSRQKESAIGGLIAAVCASVVLMVSFVTYRAAVDPEGTRDWSRAAAKMYQGTQPTVAEADAYQRMEEESVPFCAAIGAVALFTGAAVYRRFERKYAAHQQKQEKALLSR